MPASDRPYRHRLRPLLCGVFLLSSLANAAQPTPFSLSAASSVEPSGAPHAPMVKQPAPTPDRMPVKRPPHMPTEDRMSIDRLGSDSLAK